MAAAASVPTSFEGWVEQFGEWQRKVGFDTAWLGDYRFEAKYDFENVRPDIEFGDCAGRPKWGGGGDRFEKPNQIGDKDGAASHWFVFYSQVIHHRDDGSSFGFSEHRKVLK